VGGWIVLSPCGGKEDVSFCGIEVCEGGLSFSAVPWVISPSIPYHINYILYLLIRLPLFGVF